MEHLNVVLELAVAQTSFRAAYLYRFVAAGDDGEITASTGLPLAAHSKGIPLPGHRHRNTPIVVHAAAWIDPRFAVLPEFRSHRFECVVSIPLVDTEATVGMVNFCRQEAGAVRPRELTLLSELGLPLAALVAAPVVRQQLAQTEQRLADRKMLERAKGVLQERLGITEEQAYLHIRLLSRRRRTPMREVAARLVESRHTQTGASQ
jgi:hypothetical protein